jgi:hypothetical protein
MWRNLFILENFLILIKSLIKQIFIDIIHIFQQSQLIEEEGLLMLNRSMVNIHDLNTSNISDGIILYEKITTNLFLTNKV